MKIRARTTADGKRHIVVGYHEFYENPYAIDDRSHVVAATIAVARLLLVGDLEVRESIPNDKGFLDDYSCSVVAAKSDTPIQPTWKDGIRNNHSNTYLVRAQ